MVVNQWIIIRVSHNTMDVIHGYQLTYCSYSWLSKIPWMLIMVNHGSYSFIVVSGGTLITYPWPFIGVKWLFLEGVAQRKSTATTLSLSSFNRHLQA